MTPVPRLTGFDRRLNEEIDEFSSGHGRLANAYRRIPPHRLLLLSILAVVTGAIHAMAPFLSDDLPLFADAGEHLLQGNLSQVFSNPLVQVGPLGLIPFGIVSIAAKLTHLPLTVLLTTSVTLSFMLTSIWVMRRVAVAQGRTPTPGFELYFGLLVLLGGFSFEAATSSHPAEGFIALGWVLAALLARKGKPGWAGLLIGVAAGMKLWGILGMPILLLVPGLPQIIGASALAVATTIGAYLPFFAAGKMTTFGFEWAVRMHSPLTYILETDAAFGWEHRLLQAAFVTALAIPFALLARRAPESFWLVPLWIMALRFLTDPLDYHYYWLPIGIVILMAWSARVTYLPSLLRIIVAPLFYLTILPFFLLGGHVLRTWIIGAAASILVVLIGEVRRPRGQLARM